jgi:hypothetical protein
VRTIRRRDRALIAPLDMNAAIPMDCRAYKFDIVLRGRRSTFFENRWRATDGAAARLSQGNAVADRRPYVHIGLTPNFAASAASIPRISAPTMPAQRPDAASASP